MSVQITRFSQPISDAGDALKAAKMDWNVSLEPVLNPRTGKETAIHWLFRDDTNEVLGEFRKGYTPLQNREHVEYLANFAYDNDFQFIGMGSRRGQFFAQIKIGEHMVGGVSPTKNIITGLFSHDGTLATSYHPTNTVIVCQNTFMANVAQAQIEGMKFKKTKSILERMETGIALIELAKIENSNLMGIFDMLTKIRMSPTQLKEFVLDRLYPVQVDAKNKKAENIQNKIIEIVEFNDNGQIPEVAGTAWAAFNGITNYFNHVIGTGKADKMTESDRLDAAMDREFNLISGDAAKRQQTAFQMITEFAETQNPQSFAAFSFPKA